MSLLKKDQVARCEPSLTVKPNERVTEPYWHRAGEAGRYTFDEDAPFGLPYRPTPVLRPGHDDAWRETREEVSYGQPVQFRSEGDIFSGEKRAELLVVPAAVGARLTASGDRAGVQRDASAGVISPAQRRSAAPPAASSVPDDTREIRVTVVNDTRAEAEDDGEAGAAGGMDLDAVRAAGGVHAGRRIEDGAVSSEAGARRGDR